MTCHCLFVFPYDVSLFVCLFFPMTCHCLFVLPEKVKEQNLHVYIYTCMTCHHCLFVCFSRKSTRLQNEVATIYYIIHTYIHVVLSPKGGSRLHTCTCMYTQTYRNAYSGLFLRGVYFTNVEIAAICGIDFSEINREPHPCTCT